MINKQLYISLGVIILTVFGVTYFMFFEPMVARSECADWALTRTKALIPESFIADSSDMFPVGPSEESVQKVRSMYDLHYSVCIQKGGYGN
jgi:hypothetical protein